MVERIQEQIISRKVVIVRWCDDVFSSFLCSFPLFVSFFLQKFSDLTMGSSCSGFFDDCCQDATDEYALTEKEKQEIRKERKRKLSLLREGPVGFEVNAFACSYIVSSYVPWNMYRRMKGNEENKMDIYLPNVKKGRGMMRISNSIMQIFPILTWLLMYRHKKKNHRKDVIVLIICDRMFHQNSFLLEWRV